MNGITIDTKATIRGFDMMSRQVPFATATALNALANEFQKTQQNLLAKEFTLRQARFVMNTIYRNPATDKATKQNLVATVRVDPKRDFLSKFEKGGTKVSIRGKPYVAIPSKELRRTPRGLVPRGMYPNVFKPFTDQGGVTVGQQGTFFVTTKNGNRLLLQRFGGKRGRHGVRALYLFVPSVPIKPQLHFQDTALAVAKSAWPRIFAQAWANALASARP